MNVKERIDALTEAEAKAALAKSIKFLSDKTDCVDCDNLYATIKNGRVVRCDGACEQYWLSKALKEARK